MKRLLFCLLSMAMLSGGSAWGAAPEKETPEKETPNPEAEIRKAVTDYVAAFNKRDAKALSEMWSPEAVYINRMTGEEVVGRKAIAEQFTAIFKERPEIKLEANTESVRFLSPNVGVEQGSATIVAAKDEPEQFNYTAVYMKREGKWLLDRVTDQAPEVAPSRYEQLKELEWMVGKWVDASDDATVVTECDWTKNQTFLRRSFAVTVGNDIDLSGIQIIGWDPAAKQIRSWTFDSEGGFAEATWSHKKDRWYVHNKGVLNGGETATAVNIIKPVDNDSFTWQTTERTVDGELLPNVDEVLIVRE